eukprot:3527369-Prymnesium_polylepis.1
MGALLYLSTIVCCVFVSGCWVEADIGLRPTGRQADSADSSDSANSADSADSADRVPTVPDSARQCPTVPD